MSQKPEKFWSNRTYAKAKLTIVERPAAISHRFEYPLLKIN